MSESSEIVNIEEHIEKLGSELERLEHRLAETGSLSQEEMVKLGKEHSRVSELLNVGKDLLGARREICSLKNFLKEESDPEFVEEAEREIERVTVKEKKLVQEFLSRLIEPDPLDEKNILMEIRAGTGGDEATLFAADLFRMYSRYTEQRGWKLSEISGNPTGVGGYKEVIVQISGARVFSELKFERGIHRVQRVPTTESSGRVHTSAVSVAVLPEADDVDVEIDEKDLKIDVFRASGPGGQSVNTTDSAVRITHLPTGIVVSQQDEKSQHKNKAKAMKVLRARLLQAKREEEETARAADRKTQVGSGDRSEKIRTYNFKENRVTDHRINLTLYKLDQILEGDLSELVEALKQRELENKLRLIEKAQE